MAAVLSYRRGFSIHYRPDIAYSVNKLCQFMNSPSLAHWQALKRLLRFLQGIKHRGLFFAQNSTLTLSCYSNSDCGGDVDDRRSTSGYGIFLGNSLISWMTKKQPTVTRSSTESEYKAIVHAIA